MSMKEKLQIGLNIIPNLILNLKPKFKLKKKEKEIIKTEIELEEINLNRKEVKGGLF